MTGKRVKTILSLIAMALLILNSRQALSGAVDGIKLCLYTILPALFPYCVLSMIFQSSISDEKIRIMKPIERLCRIPAGSGIVFLLGILGGYPTGAICAGHVQTNKSTANKMAIFCNNAGPSFIFGVVYRIFPSIKVQVAIWLIQILSAIFTGIILKNQTDNTIKSAIHKKTNILRDSANAMLNVSMMIILCRVLMNCIYPIISRIIPKEIQIIAFGIFELTNGILLLQDINSTAIQFIICCGLLAFGGICVTLQTASIMKNIDIKQYLLGKSLQAIASMCLAAIVVFKIYILLCIPIAIIIVNIRNEKKKAVAFLN